jgi:RNA polymerase sigma-70 factor (ECF subfamily)
MLHMIVSPVSTEAIWEAFSTPLKQFLRKRLPDEESAEDLLQDIFLTIHTHIAQLRQREKLQGWVYQIARNALAAYYRSKRTVAPLEQVEGMTEELPEEDMETALAASMRGMLNCLPRADREVLLLAEYHGMKQREIAARFKLSLSGAKSRVQRAREKLKQDLLDCCHLEFDHLGHLIDYQPRCHCCTKGGCVGRAGKSGQSRGHACS